MQTRLRLFAQIVCFFVGTNDSGFSCWQGVQELQMRMGHAPGVEGFMPNMQHAPGVEGFMPNMQHAPGVQELNFNIPHAPVCFAYTFVYVYVRVLVCPCFPANAKSLLASCVCRRNAANRIVIVKAC